jgi:hypothetical protein
MNLKDKALVYMSSSIRVAYTTRRIAVRFFSPMWGRERRIPPLSCESEKAKKRQPGVWEYRPPLYICLPA